MIVIPPKAASDCCLLTLLCKMESWGENVGNLWILPYIYRQYVKFLLFCLQLLSHLVLERKAVYASSSEISSIKQAKEQQAAEARRQATPVVGDMRPLADALPELSQLIAPIAATAKSARRKSRKNQTWVPVHFRLVIVAFSPSHCRSVKRADVYSVFVFLHIATRVISWDAHFR